MVEIINPGNKGDYHIHSWDFSDGELSVEEIIRLSQKIGLEEIAINDHSPAMIEVFRTYILNGNLYVDTAKLEKREKIFELAKQEHQGIRIIYGVEADLLNENGDVSYLINERKPDFVLLSIHDQLFTEGDINEAYANALERHNKDINTIAHADKKTIFLKDLDANQLAELANHYSVPIEVNGLGILSRGHDPDVLRILVSKARQVYVNSDAHSAEDMRNNRKAAFQWLKENNFINNKKYFH